MIFRRLLQNLLLSACAFACVRAFAATADSGAQGAPVAMADTVNQAPNVIKTFDGLSLSSGSSTYDLRQYFSYPGVTGEVAQFTTVLGVINVDLDATDAPKTVANFKSYVADKAYDNSMIHRSVPSFVIQGGGYLANNGTTAITQKATVANEFHVSNTRGTIAMAKLGGNPNSATNQWFFNLADNGTNANYMLDTQNGGFTVFGRVIGSGMDVVDAISYVPTYAFASPFDQIPLRNYTTSGTVTLANFITVNAIRIVPLFPDSATADSVVKFTASSSNSAAVTASISGSQLTVTRVANSASAVTITITGTDSNNRTASTTLTVTQPAGPTFTTQPASQVVSLGNSVTFSTVATGPTALAYQWFFKGSPISGATASSYTIPATTTDNVGAYTVSIASNGTTVTSDAAMLSLSYPTPNSNSRLYALSCRAVVGTGSDVLIPAFAIGGSGSRQVIIRASGPALVSQGVSPSLILNKPQMKLYNAFTHELIASNTGWSSGTAANTSALQAAFTQAILPAFAVGSADSALIATFDAGTAYSVVVSGADGGFGVSMVEVYELGSASAKMSAISCRAKVGTGDNVLIPGIVITGSDPKQVIIRASGPALTSQGVDGVLAKPHLELYSAGVKIAENIGWSTAANVAAVTAATTACSMTNFPSGSADCAILVTLQPGGYAAVISGVGNTTGVSLIEVYEVP